MLRRVVLGSLVVGAVVVLPSGPASAAVCTLEQVIDPATGDASDAAISADGEHVAFESTADPLGTNADGNNEIFVAHLAPDAPVGLVQVTSTTGGFNADATIDGDGTHVAYRSDRNPLGTNADGNVEIFLRDLAAGAPVQVTATTGGSSNAAGEPDLADDGTRLVFDSNRDHTGGNADGNIEVFRYDTAGPAITQVTSTTGAANRSPVISGDGTRIAFDADTDIDGSNPDGSSEIYLHQVGGTTEAVTTGADVNVFNTGVSIDEDGNRLAWRSNGDLTGDNPDGSSEVFRYATGSGTTIQLTDSTDETSDRPRVSGDGNRTVFESTVDPTGDNADGNYDIFAVDHTGDVAQTQLTFGPGDDVNDAVVDADGTRIAFTSGDDLVGDNPDLNNEVYVGTCGAPGPSFTDVTPTSSVYYHQIEWMLARGITTGFPDGTFRAQDPVKRQQMAFFLYNAVGRPPFVPPVDPTFSDVPTTNPFYLEIEWMADVGISTGFPDGTWLPQEPVKRQQMAFFLHNLADAGFTGPVDPTFTDVATTTAFYDEVEWMVDAGIATGFPDGSFLPKDPVKRQQMANFLFNFETCCEPALA